MSQRSVRPSYEVQWTNYYEILGVPHDADAATIKAAYRRLAQQYHTDKPSAKDIPDAEDRFKEASEAYEYLGEARKREAYDAYRSSRGREDIASEPTTDDPWGRPEDDPLRAWQQQQQQPPSPYGRPGSPYSSWGAEWGGEAASRPAFDPLAAMEGWLAVAAERARNHDFAGARSAAGEAMFISMGSAALGWPEHTRWSHDGYERLFHSESVPPRRHRPTVEPAADDTWDGVTAEELVTALKSMGRRSARVLAEDMGSDFTSLQQGAARYGTLVGTLERDEHGRLGVRDETTGETVLVDLPSWGEGSMAGVVHDDLGKTVHVMGRVHNWKNKARATTMSVRGYVESPENPGVKSSHGLRFQDHAAWLAVHPTPEARQQQGRSSQSVDAGMGM